MPGWVKGLLVTLLVVGLAVALAALTPPMQKCSWDYRTNLWGPANELLHGRAPYTESASYGPYSSVWMPVGIGAFFWLGLLPCDFGAKLNQAALISSNPLHLISADQLVHALRQTI